ncbi:MAG: Protein GrpE [Microgenomates group bacterium GW2011_GWA2_40_6]|nr:MAG: Protein GrpE [Microgenomates group bacterium GW2011_GWA2_40_6]
MSKTKPIPNLDQSIKIAELEDKLKRSLADYINLQNRIEREKESFVSLITVSIIAKLLEALDDFELASAHLHDQGLEIAITKFKSTLSSFGLTPIDALNKDFDPATMECLEAASGAKNKVLSVRKAGYLLNGQCLRPAGVVVGQGIPSK